MAGISFDIRGDNKDFLAKMEQTKQAVNDASRTIQRLSKDFNIDGAQNQISALNTVINGLEGSISKVKDRMEDMQAASIAAMNAGDTKKLNDISSQMDKEAKSLSELTAELTQYKDALRTVESTSGLPASTQAGETETIRLFKNEDDYNRAEELRAKVAELQTQIAQLDSTDASLPSLRESLLSSTQELDKLDNSAAKAASQLGAGLGSRAQEASERMYKLNQAVSDQKASVASLSASVQTATNDLQRLKDSNGDAVQIQQAQEKLDGLNNALRNATNELNNLEAEQVDATNQWGQMSGAISGIKLESYRTQMRALQQDLVAVTVEYRNMSEAEQQSAAGQALKQKMQELAEKAGKLRDVIADVQKEITNAASDTRMFDSFTQGFQLIVSGAGAASGAMAILGVSEEDLQATQTALQASLAASNFLTQAQTALQKESALMMGVQQLQAAAAAKAIALKSAAEGKSVVTTTAATIAQKAFNLVANANPYVLLATAIISVVGALYAFSKGSAEAKKKEEEAQKAAEDAKKAHEDYLKAIADNAAKPIAKLDELSRTWKSLSNDMERNEFIKNNAQEFNNLGFQVDNINDAETLLVKNTEAVKQACLEKAKAAAASALIVQKYEEILTNSLDKQTVATYKSVKAGDRGVITAKLKGTNEKVRTSVTFDEESAAAENKRRADYAVEQAKAANKAIEEKNEKLYADIAKLQNQQADATSKAASLLAGTKQVSKTPKSSTSANTAKDTAAEEAKKIEEARQKLADSLAEINAQNIADEISQMQDGNAKVMAEIRNEYTQRTAEILKQAEALAAKNKEAKVDGTSSLRVGSTTVEGLTDEQTAALQKSLDIAKQLVDKKIKELYDEEAKTLREKLTDGLAEIEDFEKERTAIIAREQKRRDEIQKSKTLTKSEKSELTSRSYYTQAQDLAAVSNKEFLQSDSYSKIFSNLSNLSEQTLGTLRGRLQEVINTSKDLKPEELKAFQEALDKITDEEQSRNPLKTVVNGVKDLIAAKKELSKAQEAYAQAEAEWAEKAPALQAEAAQTAQEQAEAQDKVNKLEAEGKQGTTEYLMAKGDLYAKTVKATAAQKKLTAEEKKTKKAAQGVANASDKVTKANKEWKQGVQAAADECGAMASALKQVTDLLGIADDSEIGQIINGAVSGLQMAQTIMAVILTIAVAIEATMWWVAAVAVAAGILMNLGNIFSASKVAAANKEIEKQQKILDALERSLDRLQDAEDSVFGSDYINNYNQQLQNLQAQATAYQKQYEAEKSKGKKADEDKMDDYLEKYQDVMDEIADMQGKIAEQMTGTDVASAARDFAQAWLEAYASFSSTSTAIKNKFKELVQNMVIESVMAKIIQNALQPVFDKMDSMYESGATMSSVLTYAFSQVSSLSEEMNDGLIIAAKQLEAAGVDLKSLYDTDSELEGMSRTYGTASEEAIDALTAATHTQNYFISGIPTISENVAAIRALLQGGSSVQISSISSADLLKMQTEYLSSLPVISANTSEMVQQCADLVQECQETRALLRRVIKPRGGNPSDRMYISY